MAIESAKKAAEKAEAWTLCRVARAYHERVVEPNRTPKHVAQWISSLENKIPQRVWHAPVNSVKAPDLLDAMIELQTEVPETAARVRQRLEAVFEDAEFRGLCNGNPARAIRRKIREVSKRDRGNFAALPYADAPAFLSALGQRKAIAARALEFAILTAARTREVIGATWAEFNLDFRIWRIPASRMKRREEHVVYLSARAAQLVQEMKSLNQQYVFPSPDLDGGPLSNMAMLTLLRRMDIDNRTTVHGLCRATFSTWAYATNAARSDVIEACLAHQEQNRVKAAYNRAQFAKEEGRCLRSGLISWTARPHRMCSNCGRPE